MKNSILKKLFYLIIAFVILVTVGCTSIDLTKELDEVVATIPATVENDLIFPTSEGAITIQWSSDKPEVLSNTGKVNRGEEDVVVKLTITMTYSGQVKEKTVSVLVPKKASDVNPTEKEFTVIFKDKDGNELSSQKVKEGKAAVAPTAPVVEGYEFKGWDKEFSKVTADLVVTAVYEKKNDVIVTTSTIAEVIAGESGEYTVTAVVVGVNAQSFLIKDETGLMLVYNGSAWTADVAVGDKVKVTGTSTVYGLAKQFGQGSTYEVIESVTVDHGQAKELTAADCDVYAGLEIIAPEYVKVSGVLAVSGNYYNVTIEGATVVGSITYPINADEVKALAGKTIEIVGYVTGFSGGKYLNFLALEVNVIDSGEVTPEPNPEPTGESATISFADVANRTSFSTECQVWEQNGIKVTNNKGASTSNVADYSNPVRFYKSSNLLIETTNNMSKIVITFNSAKDPLVASDAFVGCTYTLEGMIGTIVFNEPSNSFKYDNLPYQIRIEKIEVYFTE